VNYKTLISKQVDACKLNRQFAESVHFYFPVSGGDLYVREMRYEWDIEAGKYHFIDFVTIWLLMAATIAAAS